jgi:hypothetical protein
MTTTERLDQIEARANAATEGKDGWHQGRQDKFFESVTEVYSEREPSSTSKDVCRTFYDADADFIAHARTDVPALVAALRAVLALHERPCPCGGPCGGTARCQECDDFRPCATVRAITEALA